MGETILVYRVATLKSQTKLAIILDLKEDPCCLEMHSRIPPPTGKVGPVPRMGGTNQGRIIQNVAEGESKSSPNTHKSCALEHGLVWLSRNISLRFLYPTALFDR